MCVLLGLGFGRKKTKRKGGWGLVLFVRTLLTINPMKTYTTTYFIKTNHIPTTYDLPKTKQLLFWKHQKI